MTAKRSYSNKRGSMAGSRGPRGKIGPAGPPGPAGRNQSGDIARLAAQVEQVVKELQIQLTRIAQIQLQLDRLASGHAADSSDVVRGN